MSAAATTTTTTVPRGKLREALDYLLWFYTPFKAMSASDIYELVSTNAYSGQGLYLNLGYWKTARTIDDACVAMAMLVAETAGVGPATEVVDVGFGFADQDMLWMDRLSPARITGLNITPTQVRIARERVAARGLADRIVLLEASATAMPLPDASCDRVLGVECAFHFDTREAFFREAFRVLRPGGRIVLADVIRAQPDPRPFRRRVQAFNWKFFMQKYAVPEANSDTRQDYQSKLTAAGFIRARVDSISADVYPGLHHFMKTDPSMLRRFHWLARLPYRLTLKFDWESVYSAYDYVLAVAEKPA
ncbi:MAG: methyltransferase domain-containing protein [Acetobacteraceae bacterium]|nr:methyltransferase domain-containing protein [Acetobacteraceae bacterium]